MFARALTRPRTGDGFVEALRQAVTVSLAANGTVLTVQTEDVSTGALPATSFACLVVLAPAQITHRLQDQHCAAAGGVWFPMPGGSESIDLTAYPQFLNAQFTVQVAANKDANNSNGDAFYNNIAVNAATGGGTGSS